jgi:hypothetical protein
LKQQVNFAVRFRGSVGRPQDPCNRARHPQSPKGISSPGFNATNFGQTLRRRWSGSLSGCITIELEMLSFVRGEMTSKEGSEASTEVESTGAGAKPSSAAGAPPTLDGLAEASERFGIDAATISSLRETISGGAGFFSNRTTANSFYAIKFGRETDWRIPEVFRAARVPGSGGARGALQHDPSRRAAVGDRASFGEPRDVTSMQSRSSAARCGCRESYFCYARTSVAQAARPAPRRPSGRVIAPLHVRGSRTSRGNIRAHLR